MDKSGQVADISPRLRIAFVTPWRFDDPRAWSGMIPRMYSALSDVADVIPISTADQRTSIIDRAAAKLLGLVSGRGYLWDFGIATSMSRGRSARRRVKAAAPDVVLGVVASTDMAFLGNVGVPIVQMSDATFEAIREFYPLFSNLHPLSSVQATTIAERSTRTTDMFVLSSKWAIDSLVRDYAVGTHQCVLAPTGPGIEPPTSPVQRRSPQDELRVLLVSSNWERKGGDVAVEAIRRVRQRGVPISFTVVGDAPAGLPDWVQLRGKLDAAELGAEYENADVLIELSVANAAGVTLTDAAAHGLPVLAADVGGVASIVRHEQTGILLGVGADSKTDLAEDAADALVRLCDREFRARLGDEARSYGESDLNWGEWARRTLFACQQAIAGHR